ncbi:MAG: hypothetical protein OEW49_04735 [Nitrosopumilus sp.]|nr:hypothetical protein [Nitrosopumilus sp.]
MSEEAVKASFGMIEILQLGGLSAGIGGGISALVNYFLNKKQSSIERHQSFIENKIALYSYLISYIDTMRYKGEALKKIKNDPSEEPVYAFNLEELENIIANIDDKIKNSYYLLTSEILRSWIYVKTLATRQDSIIEIKKSRKYLVEEYNGKIIPEYEKIVNSKIRQAQEID